MRRFYIDNKEVTWQEFKDNNQTGVVRHFSSSRVKGVTLIRLSEVPYRNAQIHGTVKWYYDNGYVECEISYVNSIKEGTEKWYYRNGQLRYETPFVNGKIHGMEKVYHPNGRLKRKTPFVDNKERLDLLNNRLAQLLIFGTIE